MASVDVPRWDGDRADRGRLCHGVVPVARAAPIIHEVFYDAVGPDGSTVFTELYGLPGLALDGWTLVGINGGTGLPYRTVDLSGAVLPADGLLLVAPLGANAPLAAERDLVGNVDWQNGPDAVRLVDSLGSIVDAVQYGDAGAHNAGEGPLPAIDPPPGSSLTRDLFGTDTDTNHLDFMAADPTPGVGPRPVAPVPVPEPATGMLVGLGIVAGLCRRGRRSAAPTRG